MTYTNETASHNAERTNDMQITDSTAIYMPYGRIRRAESNRETSGNGWQSVRPIIIKNTKQVRAYVRHASCQTIPHFIA